MTSPQPKPVNERATAPAGVPSGDDGSSVEEDIGAGLGVVAGAAVGAIAGPIGMVVGATLGSIVGDVAGAVLHDRQAAAAKDDREHAIGVTSGTLGADAPTDFVMPPTAAALLRADHDELIGLADTVCQAITEGDHDDIAATIGRLQTAVLAHIDGEERELLPAYAQRAPDDARAILAEHASMRTALAELEVGSDLHTTRTEAVRALLVNLRAHAVRENAGLYAWTASQGGEAGD